MSDISDISKMPTENAIVVVDKKGKDTSSSTNKVRLPHTQKNNKKENSKNSSKNDKRKRKLHRKLERRENTPPASELIEACAKSYFYEEDFKMALHTFWGPS